MLLIWWSAHKLTWDCTHIDEKQKGAGRGVLSAAGLSSGRRAGDRRQETGDRESRQVRDPEGRRQANKKKNQEDPARFPALGLDRTLQEARAMPNEKARTRRACGSSTSRSRRCLSSRSGNRSSTPDDEARRRATLPANGRVHRQRAGTARHDEPARPAPLSAGSARRRSRPPSPAAGSGSARY